MIAMYGATIGKVAIAETEMTTNQACCTWYWNLLPGKNAEGTRSFRGKGVTLWPNKI